MKDDATTKPMPETRVTKYDWTAADAMTEEEVMAAALSDPDAQPMTEEQLARMRPVPLSRPLRYRLKLTQQQFAERYHIPLGTLRDWEQMRSEPDQAAQAYLLVIAKYPDLVAQAVAEGRSYRPPQPIESNP